jgi:hypothetical protein
VYVEQLPTDKTELFVLRLNEGRRATPVVQGNSRHGTLSPDGHWLAFSEGEPVRSQVYAAPFPRVSSPQEVTVDGCREATWRADGREIFCRSGRRMYAISVEATSSVLSARKPVMLFEGPYITDDEHGLDYDLAPDGRFLMIKPNADELAPSAINVVLNWDQELKQRVPTR